MAYMNQERKRKIAAVMKPLLKKYGMKGTLSVRSHLAIVLTLKSGKIDFIADMVPHQYGRDIDKAALREKYHMDINQYWFHEHYAGKSKQFLTEAFNALKAADWYDESDAMIDYFNTAYYMDIHVGKWNTPYELTK